MPSKSRGRWIANRASVGADRTLVPPDAHQPVLGEVFHDIHVRCARAARDYDHQEGARPGQQSAGGGAQSGPEGTRHRPARVCEEVGGKSNILVDLLVLQVDRDAVGARVDPIDPAAVGLEAGEYGR